MKDDKIKRAAESIKIRLVSLSDEAKRADLEFAAHLIDVAIEELGDAVNWGVSDEFDDENSLETGIVH